LPSPCCGKRSKRRGTRSCVCSIWRSFADGGDAAEAGRSLVRRAQAERHAGRSAQAIALYAEAAEIARRGGDILTLAHRLRHIGDIHLDEGHVDLAAPFYDEALTLYRGRGDTPPLDLANLLRPLALLREKQGEREAARPFWAEARALYEQVGVAAGVAECTRRLQRRDP
jgi:tetratricopeptide (TPR) repeat protein